MNAFEFRDYKQYLREYVRCLRRKRPGFTLARLAGQLGIQPTYLSRVLNDEQSHFSEDQLFRILGSLGVRPAELDYVMVLRASQVTGLEERRRAIERQLAGLRRAREYVDLPSVRRELERIAEVLRSWEPEEPGDGPGSGLSAKRMTS